MPGPGLSQTNAQEFGNQFLYNPDNPGDAFNNTLRTMGYNPNAANPYLAYLRRSAPGLSNAFQQHMALGGGGNPVTADAGQQYRDYLQNTLSGANGGVKTQLYGSAQSLPSVIQQYRQQSANNANLGAVNPYLNALGTQYAQNNGQGTTDAYASYYAPFMANSIASGYGTGLSQAQGNALYRYGTSPNPSQGDIWTYLLGI